MRIEEKYKISSRKDLNKSAAYASQIAENVEKPSFK
jgi:hypothetical protein